MLSHMRNENAESDQQTAPTAASLPPYKQLADYTDDWVDLHWVAPDPDRSGFVPRFSEAASRNAEDALLRAAAFETGAIEDLYVTRPGATLTVVEQRDGWEEVVESSGQDARRHYDDQLIAYRFVRDHASSDSPYPVTEVMVREIHKKVCASQKSFGADNRTLDRGNYKKDTNFVLDRFGTPRSYAPPELVTSELRTLFETVRDLESNGCSAIVRSAYLHWALAHVHPFQDGNGRVARVVSSIPLLQAWQVPILVFSDQKSTYLQALDAADFGRAHAMVTYTEDRTTDASQWKSQLASSYSMRGLATWRDRIDRIMRAQDSNHESPGVVVQRVGDALMEALRNRLNSLDSVGVTVESELPRGLPGSSDIRGSIHTFITEPIAATVLTTLRVSLENGQILISRTGNSEVTLRLADCTPTLTTEAILRIDAWTDLVSQETALSLERTLADKAEKLGTLPYLEPF